MRLGRGLRWLLGIVERFGQDFLLGRQPKVESPAVIAAGCFPKHVGDLPDAQLQGALPLSPLLIGHGSSGYFGSSTCRPRYMPVARSM